ncbi:hypothetical protein [Leptospira limi]|uniref:Lipoprotein n=1 Tax=Leptospira limi TaxID=2950023 RepID=A0ABT3LZJ8_9LEPT|nr:hypothetical protein [Leptospira limi]MCW7463147.1 hypothetical protein [Leptospira limi]
MNKISNILVVSCLILFLGCSEKKSDDSSSVAVLALLANANSTPKCPYTVSGATVQYNLYTASTSATSIGSLVTTTTVAVKATVSAGQKVVFSGINYSGSAQSSVFLKSDCPVSTSDNAPSGNYTKTNNSSGGSLSYEISFSTGGSYVLFLLGVNAQGVNVVIQ